MRSSTFGRRARPYKRLGKFLVPTKNEHSEELMSASIRCAYSGEQCFRFYKRRLTDAERFVIVFTQTIGRRVTYNQLTDKVDTPLAQA
jgi:hypothetical protein